MANWYVNGDNGAPWQADHAYSVGDRCACKVDNGSIVNRFHVFECTTGGTSHSTTEPTWGYSVNDTCNDNGVIWTTRNASTWANAHCSLNLFLSGGNCGAGDIVYVHKTTVDNIGPSDSFGYLGYGNGTYNNPVICYCVDKDNSDALASGAVITLGREKSIYGCYVYVNIKISTGYNISGTMGGLFTLVGSTAGQTLLDLTGASNYISNASGGAIAPFLFYNCNIRLANAANYIGYGKLYWKGGTLIAPNGSTTLFYPGSYQKDFEVQDVDLSAVGTGKLFIVAGLNSVCRPLLTRCKLPSNLGGVTATAFDNNGFQDKILLHHCSSANRTWDFLEVAAEGTVSPETTIVRTGGASDGDQDISWKMVSTGAVSKFQMPLYTPTIHLWNAGTSQMTITVHGIWDSASNLKQDEVWIEVEYPADTSSGLGTMKSTMAVYGPAETPADLTTSSETWGGSLSNPNKFKMTTTFTPAKAGPIAIRVCVAKASATLYVCPKAEIS